MTTSHRPPRILFGVTAGVSANPFFEGLFAHLERVGWDVHLTSSPDGDVAEFAFGEGADYHPIPATREPSLSQDLKSAVALYRTVKHVGPELCVWGTPKISLLGVLTSRILRIPSIYVVHGLRYQGASGLHRTVLKRLEALTARLATRVVPVGNDIARQMRIDKLVRRDKVAVLGHGSANGAPPPAPHPGPRGAVRYGFVGRITGDKGIAELLSAWPTVQRRVPRASLYLFGRREIDADVLVPPQALQEPSAIHEMGHTDNRDEIYPHFDVLVLPSHREGLPTVVLEAAAYGIPSIVTDVVGAREPVVPGFTGLLVTVGSPSELADAMILMSDHDYRARLGRNAQAITQQRYARQDVHSRWDGLFQDVVSQSSGRRSRKVKH